VHDNVLSLARRRNIPVHIIGRNMSHGLGVRAMETTPRLLADAARAGFSGFSFYEVADVLTINPLGQPVAKGLTAPAITTATGSVC